MKKSTSLAILGGDMRQAFLAQLLCADGHTVTVSALERYPFDAGTCRLGAPEDSVQDAQAVILPMPAERDGGLLNAPLSNTSYHIQTILDAVPPGKLVLAGAVSDALRERAARNRLKLIDYLAREELAVRNAVPGALAVYPTGIKKPDAACKRHPVSFSAFAEAFRNFRLIGVEDAGRADRYRGDQKRQGSNHMSAVHRDPIEKLFHENPSFIAEALILSFQRPGSRPLKSYR